MIRLKHRDENKPNMKIYFFSGPNTTLPCFENPAHGFSHMRDLVNTDATPWLQLQHKTSYCDFILVNLLLSQTLTKLELDPTQPQLVFTYIHLFSPILT